MRFEIKSEISSLRAEMIERISALGQDLRRDLGGDISRLSGEISALSGDFQEFKGTVKGVAIVIVTLVPVVSAVAVVAANLLTKHLVG